MTATGHKSQEIWDFHGGLHLPDHKEESNGTPIRQAKLPNRLVIPLNQHIGEPSEAIVKPGDKVLKGQLISRARSHIGAPVHASSSGVVIEIADHPVPHPSGLSAPCVVIETDGLDEWAELPEALPHYHAISPADLRERIRWAGIVGLGGAAFPTSVKTNPGPNNKIHTLVLNGAECEPYITCDDRLMRERADDIIAGAQILMHMVGASQCLVGIEDNKPEAVESMITAAKIDTRISVIVVPTKYPSGGEKQLIHLLTGLTVPSHALPADVGVLCQNVATSYAVGQAVLYGKPLISRIMTTTGEGVKEPGNLEVLIGTPSDEIIEQSGGYSNKAYQLILGGPMMGFALHTDEVPSIKSSNCLLVASETESPKNKQESPCIRCGACAESCPMLLLPQQLYWHAQSKNMDKIQDFHLFDCIECGCCAYVCPSHIPLVHFFRFAKTEIWTQEREREKSDLARQRHEAREARLARLEAERKARMRKKKEALDKKGGGDKKDAKKAAIEAAMKRVADKKAKAAQDSADEATGE